jgi:hypothetical protein
MIHATYREASLPKSREQRSYQLVAWSQSSVTVEAMPCLGGYPMTINYVSIAPLTVLIGEIVCLHDDAWFNDLAWFVSLQSVLVYCGSYICNNISCIVGFSFCTSRLLVTFLRLYIIKRRTPKEGNEATPTSSTSKCYYHRHHQEVSKLKKEDITLPSFPSCACYYPI